MFLRGLVLTGQCLATEYIYGQRFADSVTWMSDVVIADGAYIEYGYIDIQSAVIIENHGTVVGDWGVCKGCDLFLKNTGDITGTIHLSEHATLTQLVNSMADLTVLNVDSGYLISVSSDEVMLWSALHDAAMRAGKMTLRDTHILMDSENAARGVRGDMPDIELGGRITITLADGYDYHSGVLMRNVSGGADVVINGDAGKLFAFSAMIQDGDLYLNLVRETDYYKILGTRTGVMLNHVRELMPNDALLRKLDAAQTMDELNHIMAHSIAINPILLRRPVQIIDSLMIAWNGAGRPYDDASGVVHMVARPFGIVSDNTITDGAMAGLVVGRSRGFSVGVFGYGAAADSDDDINSYSATMYGGGINANYVGRTGYLRGVVGATRSEFDVPYVFDGWRLRDKVDALTVYAAADVGVNVPIISDIVLAPYVGVQYNGATVLSDSVNDFAMRIGTDVNLISFGETVRYDVRAGGGMTTNKNKYVGMTAGFWLPDDMAGGDLSFNIIDNDGVPAYVVSVTARTTF